MVSALGLLDGRGMTLAQVQAQKYVVAILVADMCEVRVRAGEIEAPYWFLDAWADARKVIAKIQERTR